MQPEKHDNGQRYNIHLRFTPEEKAVLKAIANTYGTTYTEILSMAMKQFINSDYKLRNIRALTIKNLPRHKDKIAKRELLKASSDSIILD